MVYEHVNRPELAGKAQTVLGLSPRKPSALLYHMNTCSAT
jgi:hypothetical protein